MQIVLDVNPAFAKWRSLTGVEKDAALMILAKRMETYAKSICWKRIPDFNSDFDALANGIVWRAIRKADKFKGASQFSTWFYAIVVNECNRFLRSHKELNETALKEEMPSKTEGLEARIDLIALLDELEGDDHLLFRLVAEGEDFKTIGTALRISRGAALTRWTRLKARLRDATV